MSQLELLVSESIPATECFNKLTQIHCHRPSEAEYLRDLPLEVRVAPGAPPQPRVELRRPVRAAGPVTPQDDRVPPDVQVAEVLPWGYKLFKINIQLKTN